MHAPPALYGARTAESGQPKTTEEKSRLNQNQNRAKKCRPPACNEYRRSSMY